MTGMWVLDGLCVYCVFSSRSLQPSLVLLAAAEACGTLQNMQKRQLGIMHAVLLRVVCNVDLKPSPVLLAAAEACGELVIGRVTPCRLRARVQL